MPVSKIIGSNDQKHGTAVVAVSPNNTGVFVVFAEPYSTASGNLVPPRTIPVLSGLLLNRFDDALFYQQSGGGY